MSTWRSNGCSSDRRRSSAAVVWTVLRILVVYYSVLVTWLDAAAAVETENYHRHKVLRIRPQNDKQFQTVRLLHERPPTELQHLDFWSEPASFSDTVYLRVDPQQAKRISQLLKSAGIPYDVIVDDLQRLIDEHSRQNSAARTATELGIYDSFLTYDEMMTWIEDAVTLCSSRCSIVNIGRSFEGRRLIVVKITSDGNSEGRSNKPGIWIDAGIHAREWISHSTALYFIDRLVVDYIFDGALRTLLDNFDFYIMPCVNPDGYHFSHVANRLWRKTRSVNEGSKCRGTDANRNFGFHWGQSGASDDPCSDIYKGPKPFSESESAAVADFILARNSTWKVYLTLHSYFQMWMAPYGYSTSKPGNYAAQMSAANAARKAVESVYGTKYEVGSASDVLYRSSGTSRDWAAGVPRIPYVYTVELRDRGRYGFLLPPDQILETGVETWEGVKAMITEILRLDGTTKSSTSRRRGHVIGKTNWIY